MSRKYSSVYKSHSFTGSLRTMHSLQSKCTRELFALPLGLSVYNFRNTTDVQYMALWTQAEEVLIGQLKILVQCTYNWSKGRSP